VSRYSVLVNSENRTSRLNCWLAWVGSDIGHSVECRDYRLLEQVKRDANANFRPHSQTFSQ
jgi:hypothetical protein